MQESAHTIVAVLVLYKTEPLASPAFAALADALHSRPALAAAVTLLVVDNSREPHTLPPGTPAAYLHDGSNPGLARRYNHALDHAVEQGSAWLLLLDQDTRLTAAYLDELLELSQALLGRDEIAAIVPRLTVGDRIQSPHAPSHRRQKPRFDPKATGLVTGLVRAYNSGALLRVSSLLAAGGFPLGYPLDYLDHATLHRLQAAGGRVHVMHAQLEHDMSIYRPERHADPAHAGRHRSQLAAEIRFYREHGTLGERLRHRVDLVRQAAHSAGSRRWGGNAAAAACGRVACGHLRVTDAPQIQVLLATYNGARFVAEQIDSILAQTHQHTTILARDDGSSDGTVGVLEGYVARFPDRMRLLVCPSAGVGAKGNFATLLQHSTAPFVAFADQDDVWIAAKLELQLAAMLALPQEAPALCFTDLRVVDAELRLLHESFWAHEHHSPATARRLNRLLMQNVVVGCTALLNRPLVELTLEMPAEAHMHDWWTALLACAFGASVWLAEPTALYRQHGANVFGATSGPVASGLPDRANPAPRAAQWEAIAQLAEALLRMPLSPG